MFANAQSVDDDDNETESQANDAKDDKHTVSTRGQGVETRCDLDLEFLLISSFSMLCQDV